MISWKEIRTSMTKLGSAVMISIW